MRLPIVTISALFLLSGCASQMLYTPPAQQSIKSENTKIINRSREEVWASAVPALGRQFFVINNLDKDSGLINISYSGDPTVYVDCGVITVTLPVAGGYDQTFPAAKESQVYRFHTPFSPQEYKRQMSLDGRVNLIFEKIDDHKTMVSANAKYVITRKIDGIVIGGGFLGSTSDSISFNSGGKGEFSNNAQSPTVCVPNGKLESDILSVIR